MFYMTGDISVHMRGTANKKKNNRVNLNNITARKQSNYKNKI